MNIKKSLTLVSLLSLLWIASACASVDKAADQLSAGIDTAQHAISTVDQQVQALAPKVDDALAKLAVFFPQLTSVAGKVDKVVGDVQAYTGIAHDALNTAQATKNDVATVVADFKAQATAAGVDTSKFKDLGEFAIKNPGASGASVMALIGIAGTLVSQLKNAKSKLANEQADHADTMAAKADLQKALDGLNRAMAPLPPDQKANLMAAATAEVGDDPVALGHIASAVHA